MLKTKIMFLVTLCFIGSNTYAKQLDIGEFYINYQEKGNGDIVILLEAGSNSDLSRWDRIFDDFAQLGRTIRYTRVGNEYPRQVTRQFSAEDYSAQLNLFLNKMKINKPVVIVSHSYGALITRMFSATYPKHVAGMLLIDPNTETDNDIMRSIDLEEAKKAIAGWQLTAMKEGMPNDFLDFWARRPMPSYPEIKDIPITVIVSSKKYTPTPNIFFTDEGRAKKAKWHKDWVAAFPQGKLVITTKSGHSVDNTEPELVLNELKLIKEKLAL